jgi:tRNA(Ile)-lysidine synthase
MKDKLPIGYPSDILRADKYFVRNIVNNVRDFILEVPAGQTLAISCSGGIDSICLADVLYRVYRISLQNPVVVLHVMHGLRPEENEKEKSLLMDFADNRNLPIYFLDGKVSKGNGLQERARKIRYNAIFQKCKELNISNLFVAHNKNDSIESMLIRLFQGRVSNNEKQLVVYGIEEKRSHIHDNYNVDIFRPFLKFTRKDIERYASSMHLTWHEDSSNQTDNYLRNKIRHNIIPQTFLGA